MRRTYAGRRNGGRLRAGIQEVGTGTIRVRKAQLTQYITLTEQIAGLLNAFAQQPEYEDFTRIKTTLQSLNELVSGMGFTSKERRVFRQSVQQVATIPNTNNLPHIWTRIDAVLALIRSYGERIGVGEVIIQALTGLQDVAPGEGMSGTDQAEPVNLTNPSRLDRTAADKEAEQGTRMRLSAVVQEMDEQPGRFDDDSSQQPALPKQSTEEMYTLQQPNESETVSERLDQQLMSGAHAHAGKSLSRISKPMLRKRHRTLYCLPQGQVQRLLGRIPSRSTQKACREGMRRSQVSLMARGAQLQ